MSDFILPTFLRQTPNTSLAAYFRSRDLLLSLEIGRLRPHDIGSIQAGVLALPDDDHAQVQRDFQDIALLAHKSNSVLLMDEVALVRPDLVEEVLAIENLHALAMWFYLHGDPDLVSIRERCLCIARVRELSFTKAKRRKGLPKIDPQTDHDTCDRMAAAISQLFLLQGRGRNCVVDHYFQLNPPTHVFCAFTEDFPQSKAEFQTEGLRWRSGRPVIDVALVFRPHEGTLEVSSPGNRKEVDALLGIFLATALLWEGPIPKNSDRCFALQGLLDRRFAFPTDPEHGIDRVDIASMHLERLGSTQEIEVFDEPMPLEAFHRRLAESLRFSVEEARVTGVKLRVTWTAEDSAKPKTLTFSLGHPDSTNLKDLPEHRIVRAYLDRWGLLAA